MSTNKYSLVESDIDAIRRTLRETSDDSYFTDEDIYKALIDARALVLERHLKKGKEYPEEMYQTICMRLCEDEYVDCDCVPEGFGCKVLKTVDEIPNGFYNGTVSIYRVSTINGEEVAPTTEAKSRYRKYRKTGQSRMYYIRTNNKLNIFNRLPKPLRAIKITGIFEDPIAAATISLCPNGELDCDKKDILGSPFGIRASDKLAVYEIALKSLLMIKQLPEDTSNNAESVIPNQQY